MSRAAEDSRARIGRRLFAVYKAAVANLHNMGWGTTDEWHAAEARVAAAEQAMDEFLGGQA